MAGEAVPVSLDRRSTVAELKLCIEDALLVPPDAQKLCFGDLILADNVRLGYICPSTAKPLEVTLVAFQKITRASEVGGVRKQITQLRSSNTKIRNEAICELKRLVGRDSQACYKMVEHALNELVKLSLTPTSAATRRSVVEALAQVAPKDHEQSVSTLIHCLKDASEMVRLSAAELLPNVVTPGNEFAIDKIKSILRNRRIEVKVVGLLALSGVALNGDEAIISIVSEYCDDKSDYVKYVASDVLQQLF